MEQVMKAVLVEARGLVVKGSTRDENARNRTAGGWRVAPADPAAVCWCPQGAIRRAAGGEERLFRRAGAAARRELGGELPCLRLANWSGTRSGCSTGRSGGAGGGGSGEA